ncbi:MAG TPA: GNAT family N-acetyltransferase [Rudaea sp.]|nr:GNAT family N-acetyltransferase [Rudaea sp.]
MILTPRLRLRALTTRDLALFRALYCDAKTMRHIGRPLPRRDAMASLRATAVRKAGDPRFFVIAERESRRSVGLCSIRPVPPLHGRVELGLMLLPDARGRGHAREALRALIDDAFFRLPIDAVWVQYRQTNAKAGRLCDDVGLPVSAHNSKNAKRGQCVRVLRRPDWRTRFHQRSRGTAMQSVIGFLEQAGMNAAMRHAGREQLLHAMNGESAITPPAGVREKMYCMLFPAKVPKKAPAKKKPAKVPPKKKPAKKAPAKKKTPAKRKR